MRDENRVAWRKSTYSAGDGNCVEVATIQEGIGIRDTKNRAIGHLTVPAVAWQRFAHAVTAATMR